jgi:AcrR family transcriptional regulator
MNIEYTGGGDPARTLALLWRTAEAHGRRGARGPKPGLTVDAIVSAATEIADAEGLGALSLRAVAERLGVGTTSLYTYVPGKAELIDLMVDRAHGELPRPAELAPGWRERLEAVAHARWDLVRRHPWLLQVAAASRPPLGPGVTDAYEHELRAVDGIGLTDLEMDAVISLIAAFVYGVGRDAVEADQAERRTGMTDEQWWSAYGPLLAGVANPARYPLGSRVGTAAGQTHGAAADPGHTFRFGLARILDGIATLLAGRE